MFNLIRRDNQNVYYRQKWPNIFPSALHSQKLGYDFEPRREKQCNRMQLCSGHSTERGHAIDPINLKNN
jgi:hypothetical protein